MSHGELPIGARILNHRYAIEGVLGRGGFGITYRAHDGRLQRTVAIKEMFPEGSTRRDSGVVFPARLQSTSESIRRQFLDEAATLARFSDRSIVQVFEVVQESGTAYVVMEFLDGETYQQRVDRLGRLASSEVRSVLGNVAQALQRLHAEGVLHRDVKPANIMCVGGNPVLIDFGAARSFVANASQDMSRIVTPGYSPLEQYAGHARFGPASDVYSLAATGYHMVTGQVPTDAADRVQGAPLSPPSSMVSTVDPVLDAAIMRGLAIAVVERTPHLSAFLSDLQWTRPLDNNHTEKKPPLDTELLDDRTQASDGTLVGSSGKKFVPFICLAAIAIFGMLAAVLLSKNGGPDDTSAAITTSASDDPVFDSGSSPSGSSTAKSDPPGVPSAKPATTSQPVIAAPLVIIVPQEVRATNTRATVNSLKCTGQSISFSPRNLFDGDVQTGWGASKTDGSGQSITVRFDRPRHIRRISLTPGFLRTAERYDRDCRRVQAFSFNRFVNAVDYRFDNGSVRQDFTYDASFQSIDVDVVTSSVTMTVLGTERRPGADDDTVLSELVFEGDS